ncbi:MAG TPA: hypothetical protein VK188_01460 [Holophaga sp.]|nr:hypothetical protein [Holophaga sp.]
MRLFILSLALFLGTCSPAPSQSADRGRVECLRYLRAYQFAESARKQFLVSVNRNPASGKYQECFQCIADQFTALNLEPRFREVLLSFMTVDELSRLNDFLESALGRKLIQFALAGGDEGRFREIMTREDLAEMARIQKEPFYRAASAFNDRGLPRISGGDVARAYLLEFRQKCNQFPHPW